MDIKGGEIVKNCCDCGETLPENSLEVGNINGKLKYRCKIKSLCFVYPGLDPHFRV